MKRLLHYVRKNAWLYVMGLVVLATAIILDFKNPIIIGQIIDDVVVGGNLSVFRGLVMALIVITISRTVLGYFKEVIFDLVGFKVVRNLRQDLFDHIQSLSENFFAKHNTGELMSRIKEDPDRIWYGVSFGIALTVEMSIYFVVATFMMVTVSWKLSLFVLAIIPVVGILAARLEKTIGKVFGDISEQNAKLNTVAQENISGVRLVKAFAREKYEAKKFLEENQAYYRLNVQQMTIWSRFFPKIDMICNLLVVFTIVLGGVLVIGDEMTLGTLVRFTQYTYMVIWPMRNLGWISSLMAEAGASIKKIDTILKEKPKVTNPENPLPIQELTGKIRFENIGLTFDESPVLSQINFTIEKGKTLAIMGQAGSGKSLITSLLCRFYDPTEGQIYVDDCPIQRLDLKDLRRHIALVMQDTFLFSDTIEANIKLGGSMFMTSEHMDLAAKSAQAHDFISKMEEQYHTIIGEKGIGLSGGQKQRISMARAFAKQAPILIFDDATSALDMETEKNVQKEIEALDGVTKIIVAHRISSVRNADEILVLDQGHIVERGTHKSLLEQEGIYFETFMDQYEGYEAYEAYKKAHVS